MNIYILSIWKDLITWHGSIDLVEENFIDDKNLR